MPNNLTWRRCGNCGQLTLVPVSANVCWQCGAPCPDRGSGEHTDAADAAPTGPAPAVGQGVPFGFGHASDPRAGATAPSPADLNLPPPRPSFMTLTPQDDAVARRLLASVFPDGVDL
jgi:hypothetical protein